MEVKLFGFKINIATVIISIILGMIICIFTLCSCTNISVPIKKEGFEQEATLDYDMGAGVPGDKWTTLPQNKKSTEKDMYASLEGNLGGTVPLPENQLSFFYDTKFDSKCCYEPNQNSSSTGCACMSPKQMKYLSSRGGNHTFAYKTDGDIGV